MAALAWDGSKAFQACATAADGNDPKATDCARDELARQDKALNAAYAGLLTAADSDLRGTVIASQRAWLGYRDSTCRAEGAVNRGGTLEPLAEASCHVRLTIERTDWLKTLKP